ncbi:MAG TPA: DUF5808 domain-containing protein [Vicinamibacterales bacterium]|nr:DUF5808 domain-containing protein [Vicinamibacterales bacterium]
MSADLWLMLLVVAVNALMFHALPRLSRPDILFSVTVPGVFASSGDAAAIVRRYRTVVWLSTLVLVGVLLALPARDAHAPFVGMHIAAIFGAWAWANRRVRPHAASEQAIRVATLAPRDTHLPGGASFAAGPLIILAAAALFLWLNWDVIPDRVPSHWSADGTPTGFRTKSVSGVYTGLAVGAGVVLMMLAVAWTIVSRTRQIAISGAAAAGERTFKHVSALQVLCSAYATAGLSAAFSVAPTISGTDQLPLSTLVMLGAAVALSSGFALVMIWRGQGGQRAIAPDARDGMYGDATPDAAWKGGVFYYNPNDPALLVERRMGIGWTLNMGNRWSWLILGAMVLAIVISNVLR